MWILKGTVFGLVVFIAGFIAYVLYSNFTWHGPPNTLVDIRAFINWRVFWFALIGSIVVCARSLNTFLLFFAERSRISLIVIA